MNKPEHVYETFIRAKPEKIWEALTTSAFTRQYFHNCLIESDWTEGSNVTFKREDGSLVMEGQVLKADHPSCLSYTWRFVYEPDLAEEPPSRVTFDIDVLGEVCRLRITHDKFEGESKTFTLISQGWSAILCSLKSLLETGEALPPATDDKRGAA